jgi:hypothetical protein
MVRDVYWYCAGEQYDKNTELLPLSESARKEKILE